MSWPLLEFDPSEGLIRPSPPRLGEPLPSRVVLCFFPELLAALPNARGARVVGRFSRESGGGDVLVVGSGPAAVAVTHPGVGAPLAAHHLEQLVAAGARAFIACGGAGAVRPELALGHVVVPHAAIRDEGTSYHYLPPARVIDADPTAVVTATQVLTEAGLPHTVGLTWTTDADFRETPARIARRRAEGAIVVEMEAAALMAVARFRDVRLAYHLYAGDDISGNHWQDRGWKTIDRRQHLLDLALTAVARLDDGPPATDSGP